jgi:mRNA-degrading endonuclease RelE of RelBE toxin-antitoxin system
MAAFRRLRVTDPDAASALATAVRGLAEEPLADAAGRLGTTSFFRLHAGALRVLYEYDEATSTIRVHNVGHI